MRAECYRYYVEVWTAPGIVDTAEARIEPT
jgi:hypothetical protein